MVGAGRMKKYALPIQRNIGGEEIRVPNQDLTPINPIVELHETPLINNERKIRRKRKRTQKRTPKRGKKRRKFTDTFGRKKRRV